MKQDKADKINDQMDEAIQYLVNENPDKCAEILIDLANLWAKAGMPLSSFADIRSHIVKSAIELVGNAAFIQYKLKFAEQKLRTLRASNGTSIIIN